MIIAYFTHLNTRCHSDRAWNVVFLIKKFKYILPTALTVKENIVRKPAHTREEIPKCVCNPPTRTGQARWIYSPVTPLCVE